MIGRGSVWRLRFPRRENANIRKAAAYTHQALLDLASERLGVPRSSLSERRDGIVSGGGKSISYGELVKGQQLKLTIPVSGDLTSILRRESKAIHR